MAVVDAALGDGVVAPGAGGVGEAATGAGVANGGAVAGAVATTDEPGAVGAWLGDGTAADGWLAVGLDEHAPTIAANTTDRQMRNTMERGREGVIGLSPPTARGSKPIAFDHIGASSGPDTMSLSCVRGGRRLICNRRF